MKTIRKIFLVGVILGITLFLGACHKSVPCPAYANSAYLTEIEIPS